MINLDTPSERPCILVSRGTVGTLSVHCLSKGPAAAPQPRPNGSVGVWPQDGRCFDFSKEIGNQDEFDVNSPDS